jgi:hypothetical protein
MSCWVVPALAAEIWGIPLKQVLEGIRTGKLPTRKDIGLTFVDVAPAGPKIRTGFRPPAARPNTFNAGDLAAELTASELSALSNDNDTISGPTPVAEKLEGDRDVELHSTVDAFEEGSLDWRQARRSASRLRRPPRRLAAA